MGKIFAVAVFYRKGRLPYYPDGALQQMMKASGSTAYWYGMVEPGIFLSSKIKSKKTFPNECITAFSYECEPDAIISCKPFFIAKNNLSKNSISGVHVSREHPYKSFYLRKNDVMYLVVKVRESFAMVNGNRVYKFVLESSFTNDSEEYNEIILNRYHASLSLADSNTADFHYHGGR